MEKDIKNFIDELLVKVGSDAEVEVSTEEQEGEKVYKVLIESPREAGLLIGAHGATLHAIQSFLAMAVNAFLCSVKTFSADRSPSLIILETSASTFVETVSENSFSVISPY